MSLTWIVNRLREPSTWRGLVWLATAAGVSLSPDLWESITALGMAVAGLIGVLTRDELPPIDLVGQSQAGCADGDAGLCHSHAPPDSDQLRPSVRPGSHPDPPQPMADDFPGWGS